MKKQWGIIIGLVLTLVIVIFAVLNNLPVPINFGFAKLSAPLIIVIIGAAIIGAVIVALVATSTIWQQRREIKQLCANINDLQQNIEERTEDRKAELAREYQNKIAEFEATHTLYPSETDNQSE